MTTPGRLNRRLVLQAPAETGDSQGGVERTYQNLTTLWAQVTPLSGRAEVDADRLGAALHYRIVVRVRKDITTRHRFQDGERIYRVLAVRECADRRFLEIDAEVRAD